MRKNISYLQDKLFQILSIQISDSKYGKSFGFVLLFNFRIVYKRNVLCTRFISLFGSFNLPLSPRHQVLYCYRSVFTLLGMSYTSKINSLQDIHMCNYGFIHLSQWTMETRQVTMDFITDFMRKYIIIVFVVDHLFKKYFIRISIFAVFC